MIVGLDIGTTKVCAVIGEANEETGKLEITGVGVAPSTGLKKGVVVNIEATLRSISSAIEAAEMMSGREVKSCWTGIGGSHIDGVNSRGVVAVTGRNRETREIGKEDVERVLEAARAVVIPMDRQILEVIPQNYIVDDQRGIKDPLDMIGVRLEAEVHIITCSVTGGQNLIKCVNRAGFRVNGLLLQSLAAGHAVLSEEEKELGVALVDLGGGTTDVLVYLEGAPYSTITIPAGGAQVSSDISILKNISFDYAEKIKTEAGCCWAPFLEENSDILIPGVGGRPPQPIPRMDILDVIQPRMEEIFKMVKEKLDKLPLNRPLGAGIVITGGGAELLGAAELASHIFRLPVRVGKPRLSGGLVEECQSPTFSTAVGLVLEGFDREGVPVSGTESHPREKSGEPVIGKLIDWLKKEFF
ncbi:cell division protein FtsA [Spirochaetia bacterium]|nr:cell division protein FtsA [Spirochaetia bacterium]